MNRCCAGWEDRKCVGVARGLTAVVVAGNEVSDEKYPGGGSGDDDDIDLIYTAVAIRYLYFFFVLFGGVHDLWYPRRRALSFSVTELRSFQRRLNRNNYTQRCITYVTFVR